MTPKEKAKELKYKYMSVRLDICQDDAIQCALIAVDEIINSNPHSNPFNTDVFSTMLYWQEVKEELLKL